MGLFKYKNKLKLEEGLELQEADFTLMEDGHIHQWEYIPDVRDDIQVAEPGIYSIIVKEHMLHLAKTSFNVNKNIMEDYVHTKDITDKIDNFFSKLSVYEEYGVFPKRGILLHGAPGCGKSLIISKVCKKYNDNNDTVVIYWPTDRFRASDVKGFLKSLEYSEDAKKMILIVEDIGGVSIDTGGQKLQVEPSLLSILDNVESIFKIPTMIVATTNYPENLLQNIANRPKRFDYLYKVETPDSEYREKFLKFFSKGLATKEEMAEISLSKYKDFSVAHIEEIIIRHKLEDISIKESIAQVYDQFQIAANDFMPAKNKMGF